MTLHFEYGVSVSDVMIECLLRTKIFRICGFIMINVKNTLYLCHEIVCKIVKP